MRTRGLFSLAMSRGEVLLELCYLLLKSGFIRWCCSKSSGDGRCRQGIGVTEGRSAGDNCWRVKKDSRDKIHECAVGNQWMVLNEDVDRLETWRIILDRVDVVLCLVEFSAGLAGACKETMKITMSFRQSGKIGKKVTLRHGARRK
jgi:hypothetical protein